MTRASMLLVVAVLTASQLGDAARALAQEQSESATPVAPARTVEVRPAKTIRLDQVPDDPASYIRKPDPIDASILLNLKKVEREPERRWSLQLSFGTGETELDESVQRARVMESMGRDIFIQALEGTPFDLPWSDAGPTEPNTAFRVRGDVRYRVLPVLTIEGEVGRSEAQTSFRQPGYGFDETVRVVDASVGALVTLPWRLWRFGFYGGGGAGLLRGAMTSQLFVPSFDGTPSYLVSEATGTALQTNLKGGGEVFLTRFISLTLEAEFRRAKIDELKYDDDAQLKASNEQEIPFVWTDYFADFASQEFGPIADPSQPVNVDFSGFLFIGGLRYHF